jgi:hypothetical protein
MSLKAKHLCGQICLHKLVDDFMARTIAVRVAALQEEEGMTEPKPVPATAYTSLTSVPAHFIPLRTLPPSNNYDDDLESSARLVSAESDAQSGAGPPPLNRPAYNSRAWRAEAWKREQEREKRSTCIVPTTRRRSIA